ncbi:xanthine dehydrogenase family protein molybdopterin-binding subunit [Cupriavidus sp. UGS-1]|uniref:xanthine dehydrogenase family protein molybdopterin-binding subunit n=1 Tax=Cupriavidus sp. UGS-1 TaxID=2899826 RepID=UPI001E57F327|nr:xanthine dehydrogenase family protein molybdopterin-binding subunit [Cupriavidus sp. UGS-1]
MKAPLDVSRRRFLAAGAVLGGGLVIGFSVPSMRRLADGAVDDAMAAEPAPWTPNAFLRIGADDSVTVLLAHSEMGQGVWTSLALLIAEELDADWTRIRVEHAPAAPAYGIAMLGGMQGTVGSRSVRSEFLRYRQAGAAARAMLVQAAAVRWQVPVDVLRTDSGAVVHDGRRLRYGELVHEAAALPVPAAEALRLKNAGDWKWIGKGARRLDAADKITGRARFGIDVKLDGLLTAVVARAPMFGAKLVSFDDSAARAVPGVRQVLAVPSGVAVLADHYWAAKRGRDALKVEWQGGDKALGSAALMAHFARLAREPGPIALEAGDVDAGMGQARRTVEAEYRLPYLAHTPMEPLNCTVRFGPDGCDVWVGTQMQTLAQRTVAQIAGVEPAQVRIHTTFLGGGFGRRAVQDFIAEATHVARAAGAPVKTVWSREDDVRGGYYRSGFVHRIRVGLDRDGRPLAWRHGIAGQSNHPEREGVHPTSVEGVVDSPYVLGATAHRVVAHSPRTAVPVWYWRSVGHSHAAFAMESMVDELAHASGQDPVAYRLRLLKDAPRHRRVLELAAQRFGWGRRPQAGRGHGIAVHACFGSVAAQAVEVSVRDGAIRVHRVVCAIDCGVAVNPDNVRAQMESAIVYGLSAALHGRVTIVDGAVRESNFHDYPALRMAEMPVIEVHIVDSAESPGGAGEPGTPPIAPAVANAVFQLTGARLRELPLTLPPRARTRPNA